MFLLHGVVGDGMPRHMMGWNVLERSNESFSGRPPASGVKMDEASFPKTI